VEENSAAAEMEDNVIDEPTAADQVE